MTRLACDLCTTGEYFAGPARHSEDGDFKARECVKLPGANRGLEIGGFAGVGCGSGAPAIAMVRLMRPAGHRLTRAGGYDVSPHIEGLAHPFIRFVHEDFTETDEFFDMATRFDVAHGTCADAAESALNRSRGPGRLNEI